MRGRWENFPQESRQPPTTCDMAGEKGVNPIRCLMPLSTSRPVFKRVWEHQKDHRSCTIAGGELQLACCVHRCLNQAGGLFNAENSIAKKRPV